MRIENMKRLALAPFLVAFMSSAQAQSGDDASACAALIDARDLTILSATLRNNTTSREPYCYVRGLIAPAIHYHAQLPLPRNWNGRFLQWGDGGKDGDLDFADHRVAEGYAVANSNTGHDAGTEPGSAFGYNNRQAEIDFGYRAVHLTTLAGKALAEDYYTRRPDYAYFEGCSTGGRQGLMEAQRYPNDFDGIVAGAPVNFYQAMNAAGTWHLQRVFKDNFAGNLAVDADGDGSAENLAGLRFLNRLVLDQCDVGTARDSIRDGVIDNPLACEFDAREELARYQCDAGQTPEACFSPAQIETIADFYTGPQAPDGSTIYPGKTKGSELDWAGLFIPHSGNDMNPGMLRGPAGDHVNYLFYANDPGVTIPALNNPLYKARASGANPEFHWLDFDVTDFADGKASEMSALMDATDADLSSFLLERGGKLLLYHGLSDALSVATATIGYFDNVVDTTFDGDHNRAGEHTRLFLAPGMGHCGGGPGPNSWDKLVPLVDWVEKGVAPQQIIATHSEAGAVVNERPLCAYPEQARFVGQPGRDGEPDNWIAGNFECAAPASPER